MEAKKEYLIIKHKLIIKDVIDQATPLAAVWNFPSMDLRGKNLFTNSFCCHYRTHELCRVLQAHGKMPKAHGKAFAVRCTRQRVHGTVADGEDHLCRVPASGRTANVMPCVFLALGTQKQRNGRVRSNGQLCRAPRHRAHGKVIIFAVCFLTRLTAKCEALPCAS